MENIHLTLLNSLDEPKTVKKMLRNPKISVSYPIEQSTEGKTLKIVTPILAVFYQILTVSMYSGEIGFDLKELKNLLESAKLMTRHHTYKESLKYEFDSNATKYISLNLSDTKYGEKYKSLMKSGFTLKSFANNTKLTNALIEEQALFGKKSVTQKESMKKTLKEVKSILNKPNLPIWAIILFIVVAFLIITGGGFYGRKRYLRKYINYKKIP